MVTRGATDENTGVLLTLDRGIQVLEQVAAAHGNATARELSLTLGINLSTCYQILRTLRAKGYVERFGGGRFGMGPRFTSLIDLYAATTTPPAGLQAVLRDLHRLAGESVYVSLRHGSRLRVAAFLEGTGAVRVGMLEIGYSDHLHARAAGKCFLAFTDADELDTYISMDRLVGLTPSTITQRQDLIAELQATRERGYALDREEFAEGVGCISAVLLGEGGAARGAIGVSLPISRLSPRQDEIVAWTMEAGRQGSQVLGWDGPYPPGALKRSDAEPRT